MSSSGSKSRQQPRASEGSGSTKSQKGEGNKANLGKANQGGSSQLLTLHAAIYQPIKGNFDHWALAVEDKQQKVWNIFEVIRANDQDPFERNRSNANPNNTNKLRWLIELGEVDRRHFETIEDCVNDVPITDVAADWTCQDYVMEAHDKIHSKDLISEDLYHKKHADLLKLFNKNGSSDEDSQDEEEDEEEKPRQYKSAEYAHSSSD